MATLIYMELIIVIGSSSITPQVAQGRNMSIGAHSHYCVTFKI